MSKLTIPFRTGDVVRYIGKDSWRKDRDMIIHENSFHSDWEYTTNYGAWFPHKELVLVREADQKSMKELLKSIAEEREYE